MSVLLNLPRTMHPKDAVREYLTRVYPARGHGATDCGEFLNGSTSDAEHFLNWMVERGFSVVARKGRG